MGQIDFLVIGHLCKDLTPDGYRLGGTVTYAAITARNLGLRAGVLTRCGADVELGDSLAGVDVRRLPSAITTTFENLYRAGRRTQYVRAVSEPICAGDVPAEWRAPAIVLLGPLAQELDAGLLSAFPDSLVGVAPQGWMRQWDAAGRVSNRPRLWAPAAGPRVVILSEEDLAGDTAYLEELVRHVPIVALTAGRRGSAVYVDGRRADAPPRPACEVDPTGAGDVYAAAFLIRLHEAGDPLTAARFANVVASFSVEGVGQAGIPSRREVMRWLETPA